MKRKLELLAPGGDIDSIKAAILAGANAVYCGLNKFNARNRAANISLDDLYGILHLAHSNDCQVFLTLNIVVLENEFRELFSVLNKLVNTDIDGIIVQDLGLIYLLNKIFPSLNLHASTQLTTHNDGQIKFLKKHRITRVNLSRELNIQEIESLTRTAHQNNVLTEVFVHGSYCISFSGQCYMSSVSSGKSGNRGSCSQPCRDQYLTTEAGKDYPLNLKDNSAFFDLEDLSKAGVDSLKIEGRIKEFEYVYTVVKTWRDHLNKFYDESILSQDNKALYQVFNRDFSDGFVKGEITKDMFIDNPMNHSVLHHSRMNIGRVELSETKAVHRTSIKEEIDEIGIEKEPLRVFISGAKGSPLSFRVETSNSTFDFSSATNLSDSGIEALNPGIILKKLKSLEDSRFFIEPLNIDKLDENLYLPFKELNSLKNQIFAKLNQGREYLIPQVLPKPERAKLTTTTPTLSVLISEEKDIHLIENKDIDVYFQLPGGFKYLQEQYLKLFRANEALIPWLPSVLIGDDFSAAVEFLSDLKPKRMVTNNSGIAFEANSLGISWIAGPYLNVTNSFSLLALKENHFCIGAFISNELNAFQIRAIRKPENFDVFFSIYHPNVLMTSRQCLFHQVTGCEKTKISNTCISSCEKSSTIRDLKNRNFLIEKSKGNYHRVFSDTNYLNTEIVTDIPKLFSSFFVDLSQEQTKTSSNLPMLELIEFFDQLIKGDQLSKTGIKQAVGPCTANQYDIGV